MFMLLPVVTLSGCVWLIWRVLQLGKRMPGLPPGPPTRPLLGNIHLLPKAFMHYRLAEWAREYGDIYSLMLGPGVAIVLNSVEGLKDLLDKRSATTADRPSDSLMHETTNGFHLILMRYSDSWRVMRKAAHAMLSPQVSAKHVPIQQAESKQLLLDILEEPDRTCYHIRRYSNSVMLSVLYGKRSPTYSSRDTADFFHVQHKWEALLAPSARPPVDLLPILKLLPARWAPWKRAAREVKALQGELYFRLLAECEERVRMEDAGAGGGERVDAFMDEVVRTRAALGMSRQMAGHLGGGLIEGGTDTTSYFLQSLVLALTAFPAVQERAHAEMRERVGADRMPVLEDFGGLPYLQAVIKEVHRWRPPVPLYPHSATADEHYKGYIIPKGSTIFVNFWGVSRDPNFYDDPDEFEPERYIRSEFGTKPGADTSCFRTTLPFGVGRRICPGMHVANSTIIINAMNLVWGVEFKPTEEKPVNVWDYEDGVLYGPKPFAVSAKARTAEHERLIKQSFCEALPAFAPYEERLGAEDKELLMKSRREQVAAT